MFPIKYLLDKDAALTAMDKFDHSPGIICTHPLCPCGNSVEKALLQLVTTPINIKN